MACKGIQLCYPFDEARLKKWSPPFIVQPKLDGDRCRAIIQDKHVTLLSSEENIISGAPHINIALERMNLPDCELDGELYTHGMNHQEIHGIASRTRNVHPRMEDLEFHVFDVVDSTDQVSRLMKLTDFAESFRNCPIQMVDFYLANDLCSVLRAYDKILEEGYEGIIVRDSNSYYVRKRSTQIMKFKPKKEDWYVIVGTEEEISIDGSPKNSLGALVCRANEGESTFNVGTGFTRDQRIELWRQRTALIGRIAHVQYQHITSGRGVPRFPVFVDVVWDLL